VVTGVTGTGSFRDAAKYFSLGRWREQFGAGDLRNEGAKPWWMQEFAKGGKRVTAWPAACLFPSTRERASLDENADECHRMERTLKSIKRSGRDTGKSVHNLGKDREEPKKRPNEREKVR
jgi:hypothetical protein